MPGVPSPVVVAGSQVADVLLQQQVGLRGARRALGTAGQGGAAAPGAPPHLPPAPQQHTQWVPGVPSTRQRPCPCPCLCLSCRRPPAARGRAVLTILPPVALMCCCSASQCLSCGSAAYCNKAARAWLSAGDAPPPPSSDPPPLAGTEPSPRSGAGGGGHGPAWPRPGCGRWPCGRVPRRCALRRDGAVEESPSEIKLPAPITDSCRENPEEEASRRGA